MPFKNVYKTTYITNILFQLKIAITELTYSTNKINKEILKNTTTVVLIYIQPYIQYMVINILISTNIYVQ